MTFTSPASATIGPKPADLQGHLLIITPVEYRTGIITSLGEAEAIQCDLVDLDTNTEHTNVLFFNTALRSSLKPNIGAQVLARIGQGVAKPGKSAPWILLDATTNKDDVDLATKYVAARAISGFQPAAAKTVSAPEQVIPLADLEDPKIAALLAQLSATN